MELSKGSKETCCLFYFYPLDNFNCSILFTLTLVTLLHNPKLNMKKIFYLFAIVGCINSVTAQNVGVGTTSPHPNAVLDITSTNKGVLLPRIGDTTTVPSPPEGLIIYNKNTKSLYYYNGTRWLAVGNVASTASTPTDRITYQVTGAGFTTTEEELFAMQQGVAKQISGTPGGGGSASATSFSDFSITKSTDVNSIKFNEAAIKGTILAEIEIKFYAVGASTPYISYRLRDVFISGMSLAGAAGQGPIGEALSFSYGKYGFKDWVNSKEIGWNLATNMAIPY